MTARVNFDVVRAIVEAGMGSWSVYMKRGAPSHYYAEVTVDHMIFFGKSPDCPGIALRDAWNKYRAFEQEGIQKGIV